MTEFTKCSKRIEEIAKYLDSIQADGHWGGHQAGIEQLREDLVGNLAEKLQKFKARVEEPDPLKRTYGAAMEVKVRKMIEDYEKLMQRFTQTAEEVATNYKVFSAEKVKCEQEELMKQREEKEAQKQIQEKEERQRQEAQQVRLHQLQEAALKELELQQEIFFRRQERERAASSQKEVEGRQAIEALKAAEWQRIEEDLAIRRKREEARDEKRRRLGAILEQHRQVKEKGEQQLIAEAIANSLEESKPAEPVVTMDVSPDGSVPSDEADAMDVDAQSHREAKPEQDVPPAADLETEEMLIKQAIELSLQLSAVASHHQGNSRADKNDAHSP
eukprot:GGOE01007600.1.p1 GENE.GGOE01007600.1~~GGOE01007600.1.p1  ORF type:complete len:331 (-),score=86.71 GGOE01007600.1:1120-2112(-)